MQILLVTPMPPRPRAPGAIPVLLHAQLAALTPRHQVTLVTVAGPDPDEWQAIEDLRARGYEVHAARLMQPSAGSRGSFNGSIVVVNENGRTSRFCFHCTRAPATQSPLAAARVRS